MKKFALWQRSKDGSLIRVEEASLELEEDLESWIENDPDLLQKGLKIVGRQLHVEAGPLDLLAIDPLGRWVVIELKRGDLDRKTVAQALDYERCFSALSAQELRSKLADYLTKHRLNLDELLEQRGAIESLDPKQRQILVVLVGAGAAPGLEDFAKHLYEKFKVPISMVLFQVFEPARGDLLLVREIREIETTLPSKDELKSKVSLSAMTTQYGTQELLQRAVDTAKDLGLHVRPWKTSVMFAPASQGSRCLFTVWAKPEKERIKAYVSVETFAEFFPLPRAAVIERIGREGYKKFTEREFTKFLDGVKALVLSARASSDAKKEA